MIRTLLQTLVFYLVFLVAFPALILYLEHLFALEFLKIDSRLLTGLILFIAFTILSFWSGLTMSIQGKGTPFPTECANDLVISGPYEYVRNPMAVAGIGQGLSLGLILGSLGVILYALAGATLWHVLVRPSEEEDLRIRFQQDYIEYSKRVKCWIPTFQNVK